MFYADLMYSPAHYQNKDAKSNFEIIEKYSFATLISNTDTGPVISHLPLILDHTAEKPTLLGHCARANPHWQQLQNGQKVTAIFQGPHAYVSPSWYTPKPGNVPTWNYVAVHVEGAASILQNNDHAYSVLQKSVELFESRYQTNWSLPKTPNPEIEKLLTGIVAFKIEIEKIDGKIKLSQNQNTIDRTTVINELAKLGPEQNEVARLMTSHSK